MTQPTQPKLPDQPDGIDEYSGDFPDPHRAAERILAYVADTGDGLYDVTDGGKPLYGRDLESVARAVDRQPQPVDQARVLAEQTQVSDEEGPAFCRACGVSGAHALTCMYWAFSGGAR